MRKPETLNLKNVANQCVRSWRTERRNVSQSLAKYRQSMHRSSSSAGINSSDLWSQRSKIKFKAEPERAKLNKFFSSLDVGMGNAVDAVHKKIRRKVMHYFKDVGCL